MAKLLNPPAFKFSRMAIPLVLLFSLGTATTAAAESRIEVPEVTVISVSPKAQDVDALVPDWGKPRRPSTLGGRERQAILKQVSGGGAGGIPLRTFSRTPGRTPTLQHLILSVKRPWHNHRGFLSGEGVQRVDARSVMRFDESIPGRAIVGLNLIEGHTYLVDFLVKGEGEGDYSVQTAAGLQAFPDPEAELNHVLIALKAEASGWTEISLSRSGGAFELHTVEITLAHGPTEKQ